MSASSGRWLVDDDNAFITVNGSCIGSFSDKEFADKAASCVNALAGVEDPSTAVGTARAILHIMESKMSTCMGHHEPLSILMAMREDISRAARLLCPGLQLYEETDRESEERQRDKFMIDHMLEVCKNAGIPSKSLSN